VLQLVGYGRSNKELAGRLHLSEAMSRSTSAATGQDRRSRSGTGGGTALADVRHGTCAPDPMVASSRLHDCNGPRLLRQRNETGNGRLDPHRAGIRRRLAPYAAGDLHVYRSGWALHCLVNCDRASAAATVPNATIRQLAARYRRQKRLPTCAAWTCPPPPSEANAVLVQLRLGARLLRRLV
jgi:hypothetical protein